LLFQSDRRVSFLYTISIFPSVKPPCTNSEHNESDQEKHSTYKGASIKPTSRWNFQRRCSRAAVVKKTIGIGVNVTAHVEVGAPAAASYFVAQIASSTCKQSTISIAFQGGFLAIRLPLETKAVRVAPLTSRITGTNVAVLMLEAQRTTVRDIALH